MTHPTQIFLHNPRAVRIEYLADASDLIVWWSPKAGQSYDYRDRNFSNRDDHLRVFDHIRFARLKFEDFLSCDYDPYHCILRYKEQTLHIATVTDLPVVLVWAEEHQRIDFKTGRYDTPLLGDEQTFVVERAEPSHTFEFDAVIGKGGGRFRHQEIRDEWRSTYAAAYLEPGGLLAVGCSLQGESILTHLRELAGRTTEEILAENDRALASHEKAGEIVGVDNDQLAELRRITMRCLHSMIDESGALRAAPKNIYYLIWNRDSGFCFNYQAMAGWPHRLADWCRFMLANRMEVDEPDLPKGKMFGQLVNKRLSKIEEDGIYYAVWSAFTHWTQTGNSEFVSGENLEILQDSMAWVETYIFDEERGLFGEYMADETPTKGSRDFDWDHAVGKPEDLEHIEHEGQPVVRFYDLYINLLMHAVYTMLAAVSDTDQARTYADKAEQLWSRLAPLATPGPDGRLPYGEVLLEDGRRVLMVNHPGPAKSVYLWGQSLPTFAPVPGFDGLRVRLLKWVLDHPQGHWVNGICSVICSIDPWVCDESMLTGALEKIVTQSMKSGKYLPMPGAMPEKFDAPEGVAAHDIRPQAFAQSSWLAAVASLGVRRLHYGLAVRPTAYFKELNNYEWRGRKVSFTFSAVEGLPSLTVNGHAVPHTLQVPEALLTEDENNVAIESGGAHPLLLRSTVKLNLVETSGDRVTYHMQAFGLSELVFADRPDVVLLQDADGQSADFTEESVDRLYSLRFTAWGELKLVCICDASCLI